VQALMTRLAPAAIYLCRVIEMHTTAIDMHVLTRSLNVAVERTAMRNIRDIALPDAAQHSATLCNTLQHTATHCNMRGT